MKKIITIIIMLITGTMLSRASDFYLTEQILNKVLRGDSISGYYNTDQALNLVFNSTANAFNVWIDTASAPFVLKAGDTMTDTLMIEKDGGNGAEIILKTSDKIYTINNDYNALNLTGLNSVLKIDTGVHISSSTDTDKYLCLVGAVEALPTSDYAEGCIAYNLTDHNVYISTEDVVGTESWKAIW